MRRSEGNRTASPDLSKLPDTANRKPKKDCVENQSQQLRLSQVCGVIRRDWLFGYCCGWCSRTQPRSVGITSQIHFSVKDFRLASPCSNWPPHIFSQFINRPKILPVKLLLPCMVQVTTV